MPCSSPRDLVSAYMPRNYQGERNPHARLTLGDIREMRRLGATGTPTRDLAQRFRCSQAHVANILARRVWKYPAAEPDWEGDYGTNPG